MNKTKKSFMKAGGIIGIISASILILTAAILLLGFDVVNYDFVAEILNVSGTTEVYTDSEIRMIVYIVKILYGVASLYLLALAVANLILSIKVISQANANINKKGCIIALLVLSISVGNLLTFAFMITSLCLNKSNALPITAGIDQQM